MKYLQGLLIVVILSVTSSYGQLVKWNSFGFYTTENVELNVHEFSSVDEAREMIGNIIEVVGLKPKFEIKEADIPNAAAVIYGSKRYVLYNSSFVEKLNKAAGNKWASVSILAHEIGHHLNGHTLERGGSRPEIELEADEFSGFVLRKMGATLPQAQVAMKVAASQRASHTHPAQNDRLYAIAKGWNSANKQMISVDESIARKYEKSTPEKASVNQTPVVEQRAPVKTTSESTALSDKYILKDVYINNANYYITIRNNFVKVRGNEIYVLGRFVASNDASFPFVIVDDKQNIILVKKDGNIFDRSGRRIGFLKNHS